MTAADIETDIIDTVKVFSLSKFIGVRLIKPKLL